MSNDNLVFSITLRIIPYDNTVLITFTIFPYYNSPRFVSSIASPIYHIIIPIKIIVTIHGRPIWLIIIYCYNVIDISLAISCPNRHYRQRHRQDKGCQNGGFTTASATAAAYMAIVMALGQFRHDDVTISCFTPNNFKDFIHSTSPLSEYIS